MKRLSSFLLLLSELSLMPLAAAPLYTVTDLGSLGGNNSQAYGLNNNGQVVGYSYTSTSGSTPHAFLYSNGQMQDLGPGIAFGINDLGQVAGVSASNGHAFRYSNGVLQDLGTLGGAVSGARSINNNGQVVGDSKTTSLDDHAFLYSNGTMQDLGTLMGGTDSYANSINNRGQIAGDSNLVFSGSIFHAFLYSNGALQDLGTLGGRTSSASSINDRGQVVGEAATTTFNVNHAFLYSNGTMQDLGTLGGYNSTANSINNSGQVVGTADRVGPSHAFLYSNGVMMDLNDLIDPSLGIRLTEAYGINDSGQIAAESLEGQTRAFLLTPMPEPGTWALLGSGGLVIIGMLRRRHKGGGSGAC
ncbi:MAG: DUF3466 family protein [Acidobacteriaceae bacterium]|nr:DUF3466 family protein [Acidobacteriaceae bacterium]